MSLQAKEQNFSGLFIRKEKIHKAYSASNMYVMQAQVKDGEVVGASEPKTDKSKLYDVGIILEMDIDKQFYPIAKICGNTKVVNGEATWGGAFRVNDFLCSMKVGFKQLNPDNSIPQECLDALAGQEVWTLQYPAYKKQSGKTGYNYYSQIVNGTYEKGASLLKKNYDKDVAGGYITLLSDEAVEFDPTAVVAEPESF